MECVRLFGSIALVWVQVLLLRLVQLQPKVTLREHGRTWDLSGHLRKVIHCPVGNQSCSSPFLIDNNPTRSL